MIAVRGAVVDVAFEAAELPQLEEALIVEWDQPGTLIIEVQAHLDERTVRGVALQATAGLKRGVPVRATRSAGHGAGRRTPCSAACSTSPARPATTAPPLPADMPRSPIHRTAPPLGDAQPGHRHLRDRHQGHRPAGAACRKAARPPCSAAPASARPSW